MYGGSKRRSLYLVYRVADRFLSPRYPKKWRHFYLKAWEWEFPTSFIVALNSLGIASSLAKGACYLLCVGFFPFQFWAINRHNCSNRVYRDLSPPINGVEIPGFSDERKPHHFACCWTGSPANFLPGIELPTVPFIAMHPASILYWLPVVYRSVY